MKTPLEFLQAVYMNAELPLSVRMRAAIEAAPFVHPRLAVTAVMQGDDFAARLDQAIKRSEVAKLIEGKPEPRSLPPLGREPTPAGAPMARLRRG
jgi:hypothetical protein